ncbi:helix-turn-helix transcriptional regulator [Lactiplantibacillus daowaiensis]|uniref:Helix-turn-helix transcriptional regulator n=1 Tax=Lactiplantibacillus daowaiensis TaxID=2559918 RepID=A0ABW1S565_9LACO|nr:helix-turn-helix transcriptional regulator [Lactiplantibacillus daowaiensis]
MSTVTLGATLKQLRQQQQLTQTTLAEQLHVSRQTISSWETNRNQPDLETLQTLATFYQCSIDDLLTGSRKQPAVAATPTINHWAYLALAILVVERVTQFSTAAGFLWIDFMLASLLAVVIGTTLSQHHNVAHRTAITLLSFASWGLLALVSGTINLASMGFGLMTTCQVCGLIILVKTGLSYRAYRKTP